MLLALDKFEDVLMKHWEYSVFHSHYFLTRIDTPDFYARSPRHGRKITAFFLYGTQKRAAQPVGYND